MQNNNPFFITVDTEGDNLWEWDKKSEITTENSRYIPKFQELCEQFGFKPVYLVNYEMACDEVLVGYLKPKAEAGLCEIGMHLHAWNTPPDYELSNNGYGGLPYLIEYPEIIMRGKIEYMTSFLEERFEQKIISHRAGRWATNDIYFRILESLGYKADCSVTPGFSWKQNRGDTIGSTGSDYSKASRDISKIAGTDITEIPFNSVTDRSLGVTGFSAGNVLRAVKHVLLGRKLQLRPDGRNLKDMLRFLELAENDGHLMFMLHSSELMPGGSPTFKTREDIEKLYKDLEFLFKEISNRNYMPFTLKEYTERSR